MMRTKIKNIFAIRFILLTILPMCAIIAFVVIEIESYLADETIQKNTTLVKTFSQEIDRYIHRSEHDIEYFSPWLVSNTKLRDSIFNDIQQTFKEYESILVLDSNGIVEYTSNKDKFVVGLDMSGLEYFRIAKNTGKTTISDVVQSIETNKNTASIAHPENGKIVVVNLNLEIINELIAELQGDDKRVMFLTDDKGVYLAHQNSSYVAQREVSTTVNQLDKRARTKDTTMVSSDKNGEFFLSLDPVMDGRWFIGMKIYTNDAFATLDNIIKSIVVFLLILIILSVILFSYLNKGFLKNFALLNNLSKEIRNGNFDYVINMNSYLEFNQLAENLNIMSANIKSRIEELKLNQAEISRLNNELEERVMQRTAELEDALTDLYIENDQRKRTELELNQAKEELSAALEMEKELHQMKTRFISMVSHEYRTPLTVILTSSFLLEKYALLQNTQMHSEHIRRIQYNVKLMTSLLEDVLFIGRSDSDRIAVKIEKQELDKILDEVISSMQIADSLRHRIEVTGGTWGCQIETDLNLIKQLLMNLISNAIKYSPASDKIDIIIEETSNFIVLRIKDYGIGIPEENQAKLFTPFFRADNVGAISGTGLGLTVARRICNLLRIELSLFSKVGEGTEFILTIPKSTNMQ